MIGSRAPQIHKSKFISCSSTWSTDLFFSFSGPLLLGTPPAPSPHSTGTERASEHGGGKRRALCRHGRPRLPPHSVSSACLFFFLKKTYAHCPYTHIDDIHTHMLGTQRPPAPPPNRHKHQHQQSPLRYPRVPGGRPAQAPRVRERDSAAGGRGAAAPGPRSGGAAGREDGGGGGARPAPAEFRRARLCVVG